MRVEAEFKGKDIDVKESVVSGEITDYFYKTT